jgi:hypothetical protein
LTYVSKRTPRAKQAEALSLIDGRDAFALLMAMRTGKTKVIVDDWGRQVDSGLQMDLGIIAPGGAYRPWEKALHLDLPDEIMSRTAVHVWDSSRAKTKSAIAARRSFLDHQGPRVLLMNVEAVSSVENAQSLLTEFLSQRRGKNCFTVDESVTIKNPEAKATKFVCLNLAPLAKQRRIMTGLVSPQSPLDVYCQYKFLDPKILGHDKFSTFRARHAKIRRICTLPNAVVEAKFAAAVGLSLLTALSVDEVRRRLAVLDPTLNVAAMDRLEAVRLLASSPDWMPRDRKIEAILGLGGWIQTIPTIEGYLHVEEIHDKIAPHSFRCRLEDCYDMPESDWSFRDVEMTREQRVAYDEMRQWATAYLADGRAASASNVITQMLRLHQICCGHVVDEDGRLRTFPQNRTKELLSILRDYDGKAVIWCSYDANIVVVQEALEREFGEGCVARFWGGNVRTREAEEERFKTDPAVRWMLGTPDAGGKGRDWSVADLTIYYSSRNNLDHRAQSEDRVKADGKTRMVSYVDLRICGTVEEKIIQALRDKLDMATVINGDNWQEWLI